MTNKKEASTLTEREFYTTEKRIELLQVTTILYVCVMWIAYK